MICGDCGKERVDVMRRAFGLPDPVDKGYLCEDCFGDIVKSVPDDVEGQL